MITPALADLIELAKEEGLDPDHAPLIQQARIFLLAMPSDIPSPELCFSQTSHTIFLDWRGVGDRSMTIEIFVDGLSMTYAAYFSHERRAHGITRFKSGNMPPEILFLLRQITEQDPWENGTLGTSSKHAVRVDDDTQRAIEEALGLDNGQPRDGA